MIHIFYHNKSNKNKLFTETYVYHSRKMERFFCVSNFSYWQFLLRKSILHDMAKRQTKYLLLKNPFLLPATFA